MAVVFHPKEFAYEVRPSPVGPLLLVESSQGPAAVSFLNREDEADGAVLHFRRRYPDSQFAAGSCAELAAQLDAYFAGPVVPPLAPPEWIAGSLFERAVWKEIATIPFGARRSYGDIARTLGDLALSRAVGVATGRNPIAILVPCHRVVGSDGSLTGYGGGLERKSWLLRHEEPRLFPDPPLRS